MIKPYAEYDRLAWVYNTYWADFPKQVLPALQRLVLDKIDKAARILDLCCGTGQLAQLLTEKGYRVTGVDGSEELLRFARENAAGALFIVDDARTFRVSSPCGAVFSTYDSLNHMMSLKDLRAVFQRVHRTLSDSGYFAFDLNMEEGFKARWRGSFNIVADDHVVAVRARYLRENRFGEMIFTLFFLEDDDTCWARSDVVLTQRCYTQQDVVDALESSGFTQIMVYDAQNDLDLQGQVGRSLFVCQKAGNKR